ncbi:MAG: Rne/Rng family ribonuclease [Verrucomicrobiota bacterium]|nr:Rne/Rng family ribonuclease [Verrucomicrobiota bacterium]
MKQILINTEHLETRVALTENNKLEQYAIEREDDERIVGCIYKGRITNIEPSLEAAFIDIGTGRNAFLHYWDLVKYNTFENYLQNSKKDTDFFKNKKGLFNRLAKLFLPNPKEEPKNKKKEKSEKPLKQLKKEDIPKLFPKGKEIIVQVTKGPIGTKGPRVSTNISIPGRFLVLVPNSTHVGVSKKISDKKERFRIRKILKSFDFPENMGCICRTAGKNKNERAFKMDLEMLFHTWQEIINKLENETPTCLYNDLGLVERSIREFLTDDVDEIIINGEDAFKYVQKRLKKMSKEHRGHITHYRKALPLFERYKIKPQIENVFKRTVTLPSKGYICIDETEALISVDVNSGKNKSGKDHPATILKTNLEAVEEVARQLRLRNIGGLVVIDFIDMKSRKDQNKVLQAMKRESKKDREKVSMLPISKFGLMEMTRQRDEGSILEAVYDPCPYCHGKGKVKSTLSVSAEIHRRVKELLQRKKSADIRILMHNTVLSRLKNEDKDKLKELEKKFGGQLSFRVDPSLHIEEYKLIDQKTGKEI